MHGLFWSSLAARQFYQSLLMKMSSPLSQNIKHVFKMNTFDEFYKKQETHIACDIS